MYPQRPGGFGGGGFDKKPQMIIPLNEDLKEQVKNELGIFVDNFQKGKTTDSLANSFIQWRAFYNTLETIYQHPEKKIVFKEEDYEEFRFFYDKNPIYDPQHIYGDKYVLPSLMCLMTVDDVKVLRELMSARAEVRQEDIRRLLFASDVTIAGYYEVYRSKDGVRICVDEVQKISKNEWLQLLSSVDNRLNSIQARLKSSFMDQCRHKKTDAAYVDAKLKQWDILAELDNKLPDYSPDVEPFINKKRALGYFIWGETGSAKSTEMMDLAESYYDDQYIIFDSYGAPDDFENCFWAVHPDEKPNNMEPRKQKRWYPCIYIVPSYAQFILPDKYKERVRIMYDTGGWPNPKKYYAEFVRNVFDTAQKEHRVVVFVNSAYASEHVMIRWFKIWDEFKDIMKFQPEVAYRVFLMFREVGHLIGSGVKIHRGGTSSADMKAKMKEVASTCRHIGGTLSYAMDTQRFRDVFGDVRENFHRYILKRGKNTAIDPDDKEIGWIVDTIFNAHNRAANYPMGSSNYMQAKANANRDYPLFSDLKVSEGYFVDPTKQIRRIYRNLPMPRCLVKSEGDNFQKITGIRIELDKGLREQAILEDCSKPTKERKKQAKNDDFGASPL